MDKQDKNKKKFAITDEEYESMSLINKDLADSTLLFLKHLSEIFESEDI